jgi:hypothetical protein
MPNMSKKSTRKGFASASSLVVSFHLVLNAEALYFISFHDNGMLTSVFLIKIS